MVTSPDVGDLSPEGPLPPLILLQQLLSAATQPSPIKAIFDRQEMEVSCYVFFPVLKTSGQTEHSILNGQPN